MTHKNCEHEASKSARAACRRQNVSAPDSKSAARELIDYSDKHFGNNDGTARKLRTKITKDRSISDAQRERLLNELRQQSGI